ncbi:hypothetical protein, partial [Pantoea sp. M_9]|uniref:hypothetical protein n=1 Tax=Pantoea sp. M_9 TaxID=2608041 RepID=UPI001CC1EFD3
GARVDTRTGRDDVQYGAVFDQGRINAPPVAAFFPVMTPLTTSLLLISALMLDARRALTHNALCCY